jgi:hypothetical protein
VSQYLIHEVQYRSDRSQAPDEVFFCTILFKIFNKIETWEAIEAVTGPVSWEHWSDARGLVALTSLFNRIIVIRPLETHETIHSTFSLDFSRFLWQA